MLEQHNMMEDYSQSLLHWSNIKETYISIDIRLSKCFFDIKPVKKRLQMMMEGTYTSSLAIGLIGKGVLPAIVLVLQFSTAEMSQHFTLMLPLMHTMQMSRGICYAIKTTKRKFAVQVSLLCFVCEMCTSDVCKHQYTHAHV